MTVLQDISFNSSTSRRVSGRKSMLVLSDEEDEEDYDTAVGIKSNSRMSRSKVCIGSDDDDDDSDGYLSPLEHDKEKEKENNNNNNNNRMSRNNEPKRKQHPDSIKKVKSKTPATVANLNSKKTPNPKPKKRRRRSSARFLRLSGRFGDEETENDAPEAEQAAQLEKLNDMYSKAIQLNAANKINAVNSWGLNIIDKMDKFLGDDDVDDATASPIDVEDEDTSTPREESNRIGNRKRVNFTKASCTIDACVKIYSYRVDDAHLTSYKVLANLNRTDGSNQNTNNDDINAGADDLDHEEDTQRSNVRRRESTAVVKTVETNMANVNISKLDSAYDIDPIFHKLSQKFDEGGAKGLLLVNLGVANDGCRIVLDSKEDVTDAGEPALIEDDTADADEPSKEGMIDISNLVQTLESKMPSLSMECIHFVPQLEELRQTYALLEEEGFAEAGKAIQSKSFRYANNAEEDKAAEVEIHREALERSTASGIQQRSSFMLPNTSLMTHNVSMLAGQYNPNDYEEDDYGGGDDYADADDGAFDNFVAMDDHAEKYSSDSFRNDLTQDEFENTTASLSTIENSGPTTFLDEICAGDALTQGTRSNFNYFNPDLIEKLTSGNQWAGSAHWKKNQSVRPKKVAKKVGEEKKRKDQKQKRKSTKESQKKSLIDLNLASCDECLEALLSTKKTQRGKGTKKDQCSMTKATKQKCDKEQNLLPFDAGMNASHFTEFFMRPDASLSLTQGTETNATEPKTVGFLGIESDQYDNGVNQFDDGADDTYDDGLGFDLADDNNDGDNETNNYAVQELEGIRKVDKVRVSHATIAKKVDVRRLKKDLWVELERSTAHIETNEDETKDDTEDDTDEEFDASSDNIVSFKDTVTKLGATEAQEDVSLPFYFICVLHLANEKGLKLENGEHGLNDFVISRD